MRLSRVIGGEYFGRGEVKFRRVGERIGKGRVDER
jgi:hypothetical protein